MNPVISFAKRQQFAPSLFAAFLNPFFLARRALFREIAALAPHCRGNLLDVGCGTKPYRPLFSVLSYEGLEIDTDRARAAGFADHYYDGETMPFPDQSFDSIICNQVLEHVFNPDFFIGELSRVLRPNGKLIVTVPFVWDEHEQPFDYARYSSFGLRHLLAGGGFKTVDQRKTLANFSIIGQLINAYIFKKAWSGIKPLNGALMLLLMAPISLLFLLLGKVLPNNDDLYLDNVILAERL
jgi:SAM-dependent methyltransferase